jgi:hypothetical protein
MEWQVVLVGKVVWVDGRIFSILPMLWMYRSPGLLSHLRFPSCNTVIRIQSRRLIIMFLSIQKKIPLPQSYAIIIRVTGTHSGVVSPPFPIGGLMNTMVFWSHLTIQSPAFASVLPIIATGCEGGQRIRISTFNALGLSGPIREWVDRIRFRVSWLANY